MGPEAVHSDLAWDAQPLLMGATNILSSIRSLESFDDAGDIFACFPNIAHRADIRSGKCPHPRLEEPLMLPSLSLLNEPY